MRIAAGMGLGAVSGVLVLLAAPQHGFGWLILVAGVPMLVAQHRVLPAARAGLATAVTYGIVRGSPTRRHRMVVAPATPPSRRWRS